MYSVIVTGDFHLSTQMLGADTSEFFPTLADTQAGYAFTSGWSATGRRGSAHRARRWRKGWRS